MSLALLTSSENMVTLGPCVSNFVEDLPHTVAQLVESSASFHGALPVPPDPYLMNV